MPPESLWDRASRSYHFVGIDLGSSSVKVAQLAKRGENLVLIRLELKEIPSGDPTLKEQEVVEALKELLRGVDRERTKFFVSFNHPEVCVRVISAPPMPKKELIRAVRLESSNYFPFDIENSILDVEPCGEVFEMGVKKQRIVVAVAPRKTMNDLLVLLKRAGIGPASLVPVPYALAKLVESTEAEPDETRCWVDMGEQHTELVIFKGKGLIFAHKIPVAGRDFTEAMTGVLVSDRGRTQLDLKEAESIKREIGVPTEGESQMIADKISTMQILSMIHSPLEQLVSDISRCLDSYRQETGEGKIDSLVLLGRGAELKGLPEALSRELGIEVKKGDPLERFKHEAQIVCPDEGFAPFGAAVGSALSKGKGINLLPPEIKEETRRAFKRALVQSIATTVILVLAFIYIRMRIQLSNYEKRINVAKFELAALRPELETASRQSVATQVLSREPYWEDVFKELSNVIPTGEIYLTRLTMVEGRITMKGVIASPEKDRVLSDLIVDLERGLFKNLKLMSTQERQDQSTSEFELSLEVD